MAKEPKNRASKPAERKSSKKEAPQLEQESVESKFRPRLRDMYEQQVVPALMKEFGYKNVMQVPKLERIVLNVGMGEAIQNVKLLESAVTELGMITGQKPVVTRAKKAIAGFKLRQGLPIGTKVTLRSRRMYEFFDRLVTLALPRIRDFRGVSPKAFDGRGNYTLGINDQSIFPEIELDKVKRTLGFDITFVTNSDDEKAKLLLKTLGMPFREKVQRETKSVVDS